MEGDLSLLIQLRMGLHSTTPQPPLEGDRGVFETQHHSQLFDRSQGGYLHTSDTAMRTQVPAPRPVALWASGSGSGTSYLVWMPRHPALVTYIRCKGNSPSANPSCAEPEGL